MPSGKTAAPTSTKTSVSTLASGSPLKGRAYVKSPAQLAAPASVSGSRWNTSRSRLRSSLITIGIGQRHRRTNQRRTRQHLIGLLRERHDALQKDRCEVGGVQPVLSHDEAYSRNVAGCWYEAKANAIEYQADGPMREVQRARGRQYQRRNQRRSAARYWAATVGTLTRQLDASNQPTASNQQCVTVPHLPTRSHGPAHHARLSARKRGNRCLTRRVYLGLQLKLRSSPYDSMAVGLGLDPGMLCSRAHLFQRPWR